MAYEDVFKSGSHNPVSSNGHRRTSIGRYPIHVPAEFEPYLLPYFHYRAPEASLASVAFSGLPFQVRRAYFLTQTSTQVERGHHAHRALQQFIFPVLGEFEIEIDDGRGLVESFTMSAPDIGLYLPAGYWRRIYDISAVHVIGVLASQEYDETDYIRNRAEFEEWANK